MAVQEQLPLKVKPQFLDMVWYSVSLFREGMIATLGGRNIWWSQSQGGGKRGAEYLALQCRSFTMMMQRRALAEPAQWSDQSPNMPPHPSPASPTTRPHVHLLTSSDFHEQPSLVHLTFETSSHRLVL